MQGILMLKNDETRTERIARLTARLDAQLPGKRTLRSRRVEAGPNHRVKASYRLGYKWAAVYASPYTKRVVFEGDHGEAETTSSAVAARWIAAVNRKARLARLAGGIAAGATPGNLGYGSTCRRGDSMAPGGEIRE